MIELLMLMAAGGALAAGGVALWVHTRAARVLGEPTLSMDAPAYGLGGLVRCRISSVTRGAVEVAHITFTIECVETIRWTEGSGKNRKTRTRSETVWRAQAVSEGTRRLLAGQAFEAEAELELPEQACPSFKSANNAVAWMLRFDAVLVPRNTAVSETGEIRVEPRLERRRAGAA